MIRHSRIESTLRKIAAAGTVLAVLLGTDARAKNVDLSTVPARDPLQLTLYNSEDITLVRETRKVSFKP